MFLNKIADNFRQYGFFGFSWRILKKIFRMIGISYDSYYYLMNEIDYSAIQKYWEANSIKMVKKLELADYEHGDPSYFSDEKMSLLNERFLHGNYVGYGAFDKDRLVYSAMISLKEMCFPTPEVSGELSADEFLISDSYCDPDKRGNGYHNKMTVYLLMKGYEMGFPKAVATVLKENKPSLKSFLKSGFQVEFDFYTLRIGKKSFTNYYKKKNLYASR